MIADQNSSQAPGAGASSRPTLREQIAFTQSSPAAPGGAPPWLVKLDRTGAPSISRPPAQGISPDTPPGIENPPSNAGRPFSPARSRLPQRELRVKVWEGENVVSAGPDAPADLRNGQAAPSQTEQKEEQAQVPSTPRQEKAEEAFEVEDLPTVLMPSTFAGAKDEQSLSSAARNDPPASNDATQAGEENRGSADQPTHPIVAHLSPPERVHAQRSSERPFPAQSYRQAVPPQPSPRQVKDSMHQGFPVPGNSNPNQSPLRQQSARPAVSPSFPGIQQAPAVGERVAGPSPSRPGLLRSKKSRMMVLFILPVLVVVLVSVLIYWITAYQPFSVPAVTRTSLSFNNTKLGIALQYPQGWTNQLDTAHQTASFFDANRVDQVTISVTSVNGSSVTTYMNKEAAQLGLTAQKSLSTITFAGTTWQRVQGTLQVSGASDTEILLVAQHGNHFYTIAQIAPAATYAGADHLFFTMFRASFQFV